MPFTNHFIQGFPSGWEEEFHRIRSSKLAALTRVRTSTAKLAMRIGRWDDVLDLFSGCNEICLMHDGKKDCFKSQFYKLTEIP